MAVVLTGFTVGFALFYEVGFVLMLPLVFTIAASANIPLLYVGVPMAAALSVTHGFLPPHPGPTAIATIFNADMGKNSAVRYYSGNPDRDSPPVRFTLAC
ncbi:gluconate transporter, high-affinity GNT I system [Escherichia coli]|nr:gluconate transporter, high-affinity GNT I system [Escherichia coli]